MNLSMKEDSNEIHRKQTVEEVAKNGITNSLFIDTLQQLINGVDLDLPYDWPKAIALDGFSRIWT